MVSEIDISKFSVMTAVKLDHGQKPYENFLNEKKVLI